MSEVTRRTFIKQVSAGAAGVAAVGAMGMPSASAQTRSRSESTSQEAAADTGTEPVMAFVRDRKKGEVTLLVGHREIVHHDPELVRRLLHAAK
jgi:hypothetical protein